MESTKSADSPAHSGQSDSLWDTGFPVE